MSYANDQNVSNSINKVSYFARAKILDCSNFGLQSLQIMKKNPLAEVCFLVEFHDSLKCFVDFIYKVAEKNESNLQNISFVSLQSLKVINSHC
jgi:hypothetical protein